MEARAEEVVEAIMPTVTTVGHQVTLAIAIGCHSLGICKAILLPLQSFSHKANVSPRAKRARGGDARAIRTPPCILPRRFSTESMQG